MTAVLYLIMPLAGVYIASPKKKYWLIEFSLIAPFVIFYFVAEYMASKTFFYIALIFGVVAYGFAISMILRFIIKTKIVTSNTIYAAISGYFLLGLIWALLYGFLALDGVVVFESRRQPLTFNSIIYYSFVTLTTLGFGDIIPGNETTQFFAMMEALAGQFYITVLISLLIGKYLSHSKRVAPEGQATEDL